MPIERIFALVGISFGLVFVLVNAGGLAPAAAWPARILGVALAVAGVWFAVVRAGKPEGTLARGSTSARAYWMAVIAEVIAIPAGAFVINQVLKRPEFTVLWVVACVGLHFLPARAFGGGEWMVLGLALVLVAVGFGVATALLGPMWASAGAVAAGFCLLGFPLAMAGRGRRDQNDG